MEADIICVTETGLNISDCSEDNVQGSCSTINHDTYAYDQSYPMVGDLEEQQHGGIDVY